MTNKREVHASVKDERLIKKRRDQMIKGAVALFKQKGFHRTTTREIAKAAGFSIGTLYEYIRTKEDVLYLVVDSIYDHVSEQLQQNLDQKVGTLESLKLGIANFFHVMDEMQAEVLVMYQEVKSLSKDARSYILKKELEMVAMFENMLTSCVDNGELDLTEQQLKIIAHDIFVLGQMWGFRRWAMQKLYTLDEYIELQTKFIFSGIKGENGACHPNTQT